ncbi:hypothetical protein ON010_g6679 [Phytophthora cinnamomi]|nr:hypothetical protein ON010_g6679 [Phytophthora cinnamomi]
MPFGLTNAPLLDTPKPDRTGGQGLHDSDDQGQSHGDEVERSAAVQALTDEMTVFKRNIPAHPQMGPVLGRSSYIDGITLGAPTWGQLCEDLNTRLFRLRYLNISVSLPKSEFGKLTIPYLSHEISAEGIRSMPKIAKCVQDLPFPSTIKGVQSFLGSLNYYNNFIEDLPVVAASLYELTEDQVHAGRDLSERKKRTGVVKVVAGDSSGSTRRRWPRYHNGSGYYSPRAPRRSRRELIPAKRRVKKPPAFSIVMLEIVIQQAQGLINCNQPNLQRRLAEYEVLRTKFKTVQLVHAKRLFNQAADYLTTKTLALGKTWQVEDADERLHLQLVSKIPEKVMKPASCEPTVKPAAPTLNADLDWSAFRFRLGTVDPSYQGSDCDNASTFKRRRKSS